MAQAGIHGLVGMAARKWTPNRAWLMLGIVLGNVLPDADNLAVAVATVAKLPTEGLHRTFTHSLFTVAAVVTALYIVAWATRRPRWGNLGLGLGIGTLMHILLDLLVWFDGVEWWSKLMMPAEFLCFALFFVLLDVTARKRGTDGGFLRTLRAWTGVQGVLFVAFTVLVYTMEKGFMTPYGALYLISLGLALWVTIHMRETIEAMVQ
jgi:membrane-bound metal-dependent hydrolase YbcI (DUF457 family)